MNANVLTSNRKPRKPDWPDWVLGGALFEPIRTFVTSVFIVAGPWILSVLALAIISLSLEPQMGRVAVEDLRLAIIYSLCIAPLTAGPIGVVMARQIRAAIDDEDDELVPDYFLAALILAGTATLLLALMLSLVLGIADQSMTLAFVFLSVVTALLWTCLSALSALRAFGFLITAFGCAMVLCLVAAFLSGLSAFEVTRLIWAFGSGLAFFVALTLARIVDARSRLDEGLRQGMAALVSELARNRFLVFGTFLAFCGVWIDKWVVWAGPTGERSLSGFLHYGNYDSVMFLAHLSIIPTFAAMHILHDGEVTDATRDLRRTLNARSNRSLVRTSVDALGARVWNGIFTIFFVQATITATLVLIAPIMSKAMHFDFSQFLMLRVGLVAVFVHSIFYVSSSVLLVCGRHRHFFLVQALFFLANAGLSTGFLLTKGPSAFGIFLASLVAALVCFVFAYRALQRYDYLVLVGENDALFRN